MPKTDHLKEDPKTVDVARRSYKAYAENSDGKTFDGRDMPSWEKLTDKVRDHWTAATKESIRYASELMRAELDAPSGENRIAAAKHRDPSTYREDEVSPDPGGHNVGGVTTPNPATGLPGVSSTKTNLPGVAPHTPGSQNPGATQSEVTPAKSVDPKAVKP